MKIEVWVGTSIVGSKCSRTIEVDIEDWEEMSEEERDQFCQETMWELIDWDYNVVED